MTVCIAARSASLDAIVSVSDMMFSSDERSVESATVKFAALRPRRWVCLYAGDQTIFEELVRVARHKLDSMAAANLSDAMAAVEFAYGEALKHRIERLVLAQCQMTHDEFFSSGVERLGESLFQQLYQEMRYIDVGTELLVIGFDDNKAPHLFSSDKFGVCALHDAEAYHAIGSGAFAALGWLSANYDFRFAEDVVHVAYRLIEAKFCAETSRAVGRDVVVIVQLPDGEIAGSALSVESIQLVRDAWEAHRNQEPAREVLETIEKQLQGRKGENASMRLLAPPPDSRQIKDREG